MSVLPNSGLIMVPDVFDFDARMTLPEPRDPNGRSLRIRNKNNLETERFNEESIEATLNCRDDRAGFPDVGPTLKAFYAYTQDDMTDMIGSEIYCTGVGPLPAFIRQQVERSRRKRSERSDADKIVEKEKSKGRPLQGSMVLANPITRIPGQQAAVTIPAVVLQSMTNKLSVPLNWFTNERLYFIQHRLHDLHSKLMTPELTIDVPSPLKVVVFDMQKMMAMSGWGPDELPTCLSPLKWIQASINLEAALAIVSEQVPLDDPNKHTFVAEYRKHRLFFKNYEKFEENYADLYAFERLTRHEILQGHLFDRDYYARKLDGLIDAKQAAAAYASSSSGKRAWDRDPETPSRQAKAPRHGNDSPGSFRGDNPPPSADNSGPSFRGPGTPCAASCIACDGPHRLKKNHPASATSFSDGTSCFSLPKHTGGELWTVKPFRGADTKRVCVEFNLPNGCQRPHDATILHICSLCGKPHPALPRNALCSRVA